MDVVRLWGIDQYFDRRSHLPHSWCVLDKKKNTKFLVTSCQWPTLFNIVGTILSAVYFTDEGLRNPRRTLDCVVGYHYFGPPSPRSDLYATGISYEFHIL